jgi:hypothetical protein
VTKWRRAGRSGLDDDLVFDVAHSIDLACDAFGGVLLGGVLCEAREDHDAVHGFDGDTRGVDVGVTNESAFYLCGDCAVADIAPKSLLTSKYGARGEACADKNGSNGWNDEEGFHGKGNAVRFFRRGLEVSTGRGVLNVTLR